jgi:hypothetical protein
MELKHEIAARCLYGFIKDEKGAGREQCLRAITLIYGKDVASLVRDRFNDRG